MRNGIIYKSDGDKLIDIYRKVDIFTGELKEPLTPEEMVLIYAVGKKIREEIGQDG